MRTHPHPLLLTALTSLLTISSTPWASQAARAEETSPAPSVQAAPSEEATTSSKMFFTYTSISRQPYAVSLPTVDLSRPELVRVRFVVVNGETPTQKPTPIKVRFRGRYTDERTVAVPALKARQTYVGSFEYRIRPCTELGKKPYKDPHLANFMLTMDQDLAASQAYARNRVASLSFTYRDPGTSR